MTNWQVKEWNGGILIIDDTDARLVSQQMISFTTKEEIPFAKEIIKKLSEWVDREGESV